MKVAMFAAALLGTALVATAVSVPPRAQMYRADMTQSAFRVFGPSAPVATLAGQVHQESGWNCDARSRVGALGCTQFMPSTAEDMARQFPHECAPANPMSARWAFACRDRYMRSLLAQTTAYGTAPLTECAQWWLALKDYNGGHGWTSRQRRAAKAAGANPDDPRALAAFTAGRSTSNHRENTEYPERIFRAAMVYEKEGWGRALPCTL